MKTAIGILAALLTTSAWVPQIIKTRRSRSAHDLAWSYLMSFGTGVALWFIYAIWMNDLPLALANGVSLVFVAGLVVLKNRSK